MMAMLTSKVSRWCLCAVVLFSMTSCATTKFNNIEDGRQFEHVEDEKSLWKRVEDIQKSLLKSDAVYPDEGLHEYVNSLLGRLVAGREDEWGADKGADIEAYIIYDSDFNAAMYPNGFMIIHTGLLANIDSEAQLVTVMGHELTHYLHRHALKGQNRLINVTAALNTLSVAATGAAYGLAYSGYNSSAVKAVYDAVALGLGGMYYGYSRSQEKEADTYGFELMTKLGYDPHEAKATFENMYEAQELIEEKIRVPYFYQSHPKTKARIRHFEKLIEDFQKTHPPDPNEVFVEDEGYMGRIKGLLLDNLAMDLAKKRLKLARRQLDKYKSNFSEDYKSLYYEALILLREDKKDDAMEKLVQSKEANPDNPKVLKELGLQLYKNGDKARANENFRRFLELQPDAIDADYIRGYINE